MTSRLNGVADMKRLRGELAEETFRPDKNRVRVCCGTACVASGSKKVVKGLGFTRLNQVIERPDTAAIRGMVKKVPHLVEIVK